MKGNFHRSYARLTQSAERKALNLVVVGSCPTVGDFMYFFLLFFLPLRENALAFWRRVPFTCWLWKGDTYLRSLFMRIIVKQVWSSGCDASLPR